MDEPKEANEHGSSFSSLESNEKLTLEGVKLKFEEWRSKRKRGARIPEELWSLAVDLTQTKRYSMRAITKTLNISWEYLTRRIIESKRPIKRIIDEPESREPGGDSFVELKMDNGASSSHSSCFPLFGTTSQSQCILEIRRCDGSHLKFFFPSESRIHIDLLMLFEMFVTNGICEFKNRK